MPCSVRSASRPSVLDLATGWCQHSIYAGPPHVQALRDFGRAKTLGTKSACLLGFCPCGRCPALVFALGLRLGNSFALALQHHLALELPDSADHREQQLSGRGARVHPEVKDIQMRTLALHPVYDLQQMLG